MQPLNYFFYFQTPERQEKLFDGSLAGLSSTKCDSTEGMSSTQLFTVMQERNQINSGDVVISEHVRTEDMKLISDITEFISQHARIKGQATTDEVVTKFKKKIDSKDSAKFKSMLEEVCFLEKQIFGSGIWQLKPQYR